MYPHERSLVEEMKKEKFTLLAVNSDSSPGKVRAAAKREKLTWPMIFDNGGTGGPIATKWGVSGWPTIYVIDAAGVIRFKGVRDAKMTDAVKQLLAEAKKRKK
jgi:peroxiredoxin